MKPERSSFPTRDWASVTNDPSAATTGEATSGGSTGGFVCDPNEVEDTLAFTYVSQFDTGIPDMVLQASYYNSDADEVMIMSFSGKARRFMVDGTAIGDVFDVPAEALPKLDGATYDPVGKVGLLINQDCVLTEVEPQTLAVLKTQALGFGMSVCAGLALGLDGNLYIASYGTDEMVTLSRDGLQEVGRVNVVQAAGIDGFDGIALIAGSENFLIMSTAPTTKAAIVNPAGGVVVAASDLGQASAPMIGGMPMLPDARTRSRTTEPCSSSNQRDRLDLPMMICVMLLARARLPFVMKLPVLKPPGAGTIPGKVTGWPSVSVPCSNMPRAMNWASPNMSAARREATGESFEPGSMI